MTSVCGSEVHSLEGLEPGGPIPIPSSELTGVYLWRGGKGTFFKMVMCQTRDVY